MLYTFNFFFVVGGYQMNFELIYFLLIVIPLSHLFFYQIKTLKFNDPTSCLRVFKSNNFFGLIIFINILIVKIL